MSPALPRPVGSATCTLCWLRPDGDLGALAVRRVGGCAVTTRGACQIRTVQYIGGMAALALTPKQRPHRVLVVGGLTRLEQQYRCCLGSDVSVEVANSNSSRLSGSVSHADSVVVIVPRVSHSAVQKVQRYARRIGVPVVHATSSSAKHVSERILQAALGHR